MAQQLGASQAKSGNEHEAGRRMMDDFYAFRKMLGAHGRDVWMPPTDVYETHDDIVIKMSVPGIEAQDVRILFDGDMIIISGYRGAAHEPAVVAYHQMEIRSGYFERRVVVHRPIDPEAASAEYRDGFLWVRIPKAGTLVRRVLTIRLKP